MKLIHYILYMLAAIGLAACDSGDIQDKVYTVDEKGKTVKLTAQVSGLGEWEGTGNAVAVAGFTADSKFAILQKALPSTSLRKRLITLAVINMSDYSDNTTRDTIRLDLGNIDVGRFGVLQTGLFDRACIQCHGASGRSAAGLNLTKGNARAALVDVPSSRKEGYMRVESGNAEGSLLHLILSEGGENLLSHNHTEILSSQFKSNLEEVSSLIDSWIESLP